MWGCTDVPLAAELRDVLRTCRSGLDTAVQDELDDTRGRWLARPLPRPFPAPQTVGEWVVGDGRTLADTVAAIVAGVSERVARVRDHHALRRGLDPLGTGVPIVQGPMANVAERTGLARAVRAAGALPFAALGALDPRQAADVLARFADEVPAPWGVGVIGFDVMPHRDAHLRAIEALGPRGPAAIVLAGGSPALARMVGPAAWLHCPSARLVAQALDAGVRCVVLEGHEAGGHVGRLTSAGLWEEGLAAVEAATGDRQVVLAGGIGDDVSAAFAAAMAAGAVEAGARVVLQAGTAFFFTHEIVEHGQLAAAAQEQALACTRTVLVGSSVNLPLRCSPNPFTEETRALERAWSDEGMARPERRTRLEHRNLGRTRLAAKGIVRNPAYGEGAPGAPRYVDAPASRQLTDGAFTMGDGATVETRLDTVAGVVRRMAVGGRALLEPAVKASARWRPVTPVAGSAVASPPRPAARPARPDDDGRIAIVGLGCLVPGAGDVATFWRNLVEGRDAVEPIPEERWPTSRYFDPAAAEGGPTRSYARHAGVVRFQFDPVAFRIPPRVWPTLDAAQQLALLAAREAVESAGWTGDRLDRRRAAVVLGNSMGGEHAKHLSLRVRFRDVLALLREDEAGRGWSAEAFDALEERMEAALDERLPPVDAESMAGLLANVVAGRVASWLDWMGGNLTVDAACAASLASLLVAVDWLRAGRCDAVLAGGVDADLSAETFVGFCRTEALSRTGSSPFSTQADGFVMGEGAAVFALKRLRDAERDGDRIRAVIHGVGQASDGRGRGITAPRAEGQQLAIRRALEEAGVATTDVGVLEAHGTGTAVGDRTETDVLARKYAGVPGPVWLGSVKSNIGHLKGAAGAAGLLKLVLTLETGIVPPTLRAGPFPEGPLRGGPLRLARAPTALAGPTHGAVSAFGFGGTDFHAVLSSPSTRTEAAEQLRAEALPLVLPADAAAWGADASTPLLLPFGAADRDALAAALAADHPTTVEDASASPVRVVVVADPARRDAAVRAAHGALGTHRRDLWWGDGAAVAPVWAFPGQGSQRRGSFDAVARVPVGARELVRLEEIVRAATGSDLTLRDWEARATDGDGDPVSVHVVLFAAGVAWSAVLRAADTRCGAVIGHSLGGFAAAVAAGVLSVGDAAHAVVARGRALAACPPGAMVAVRLGADEAANLAAEHGLWLAAVNAPGQCVVAGDPVRAEAVAAHLGPSVARRLAVGRAYHTPLVEPAVAAVAAALAHVEVRPATAPLWSAATGAEVHDVTGDLAAAILSPVRFDRATEALRDRRLLVELGPGTTLARFAEVAGLDGCSVDPADGAGPATAAAALVAAGSPGLARLVPATWLDHALPFPRGVPAESPRRVASVRSRRRVRSVEAPVTVAAVPDDPIRAAVRAAICEVTGYPDELVQDGVDLEGDLGVDSIRKMEILGLLEKRLGFATAESDYAALSQADLAMLVAHVRRRLADGSAPAEAPAANAGVVVAVEVRAGGPTRRGSPDPRVVLGRLIDRARTEVPSPVHVHLDDGAAGEVTGAFLRSLQRERGLPFTATGLTHTPIVASLRPARSLPRGCVVVATGSPTGILRPCLDALADLEPRVVILSRDRCDVTDAGAVAAAVAAVVAEHGRIDLVLHAAGSLRDKPAEQLTEADADAVWGPKWLGARHLLDATRDLDLVAFVTFTSLVARVGNAGQTVYAAANAAMTTLTHPRARTLHVAWSAWSGVGMAAHPALQAVLASRGVVPLAPADGAAALRALLEADVEGTVWVGAQRPPQAVAPEWPLGAPTAWTAAETRFSVPLDPTAAALGDHRVAGRALVPAAVWMTALLEAAHLRSGTRGSWAIDGFDIVAPTFVDRVRDDVEIVLRAQGPGWRGEVVAGGAVVATATLAPCAAPATETPPEPLVDAEPADRLYTPELLFHGPTWQVLERISSDGNGGMEADLSVVMPGFAGALDGAHQLLAAWSGRSAGWMGLPVGADRWVLDGDAQGPLRLETQAEALGQEMRADVTARDATGRVVLRGTGVRLRAAATVPAK